MAAAAAELCFLTDSQQQWIGAHALSTPGGSTDASQAADLLQDLGDFLQAASLMTAPGWRGACDAVHASSGISQCEPELSSTGAVSQRASCTGQAIAWGGSEVLMSAALDNPGTQHAMCAVGQELLRYAVLSGCKALASQLLSDVVGVAAACSDSTTTAPRDTAALLAVQGAEPDLFTLLHLAALSCEPTMLHTVLRCVVPGICAD